ncbi:MAG TPA: SH3 domain-containing protein [candidate division Zixibacteria bacterium]|nr:SH3 domain-containing protein [candidate division Zixibacteria bacterium]
MSGLAFRSFACLVFLLLPTVTGHAAGKGGGLSAGSSGASLYSRQDVRSEKLAVLAAGEPLTPLAEAVGTTVWYLVRTRQGLVGWVQASEVDGSAELKEALQEPAEALWNAVTSGGQAFQGSYTVEQSSAEEVSGRWTLRGPDGKIILRGTWSARKFSTGWNGSWRASVEGRAGGRSGSWTADLRLPGSARLPEMFEAARRAVVRGIWASGQDSGSWSIREAN